MEEKLRVAMFGQKRLSREGGVEIVVKELCTRMAQKGYQVTCYNRSGHHVSGAEYDDKKEYQGICQKYVPTIEKKGLAAVSSSFFAALCSGFGKYDVVHIHAEGPAFFSWLPKMFSKRVIVTIHAVLIPPLLQNGAVMASVLSELVTNVIQFIYMKNKVRFSIDGKALVMGLFSTVTMSICVFMLMQLRLPNTVGLFVEVTCGTIVYVAVNIAMKNTLIFDIIEKGKKKILRKN